MEAKIFETHAHYEDKQFDEDREELLEGLAAHGIEYVVNVSYSLKSVKETLKLMEQYDFIYGAVGIHPEEAGELSEESFAWLSEQLSRDKVVAVGEIGLDYYWKEPEPELQKIWFERQIDLAREKKLPMIIHSREAAKDTYEILKAGHAEEIGGGIHCFSYPKEMAEKFLDLGFYLGIGGVVTFKNSKKLKEVVEYMPLDRILLETDCPYMAPVPNRGKRNSSLNLKYIAAEIGRLKGCSTDEVIIQTAKNARKMYRI